MLNLGGLTYRVIALESEKLNKLSGSVDEQRLLIQIQDDLLPAVHDSVFLHEVGHIFGLKWTKTKLERERFADDFAEFMQSFLHQNAIVPDGWSIKLRDDKRKAKR